MVNWVGDAQSLCLFMIFTYICSGVFFVDLLCALKKTPFFLFGMYFFTLDPSLVKNEELSLLEDSV